jgi:hypothetical protein
MQRSFSGSGLFLTNRSESEQEYARPLLTPAEVNQLSQDDGILLVGGLLPYRGRKVRYFLDPRFKGRDGRPPPDKPEEQARELLARLPNDWDGLIATPPSCEPPASPTLSVSGESAIAEPAVASPEAPPGVVENVWNGFFAKQDSPTSDGEGADSGEASSADAKELPL